MKTTNFLTTLAMASVVLFSSCKKDSTNPSGTYSRTIPLQSTVQSSVSLGSDASTLAVLAGSSVTNTGNTIITGDLGLSPGTSVGGFPPGILNGTQHINDAIANQAKLDLTAAYNDAAGRTCTDIVTLSGNIGGLTLTPGLYKSTSSLAISSGDLTFDAKGNANAVFIIQIASSFTTTSGRQVILSGGAQASNIFWQVGSSATFGTTSVLKGTFMAMESITFNTGATLDGKAQARTGTVILAGNTIVIQ
ncbi:MAG: ice-binding family protein [Cytophagaceae bacterium]